MIFSFFFEEHEPKGIIYSQDQEKNKRKKVSVVFTISSDCNGNHMTPGNIALPPP